MTGSNPVQESRIPPPGSGPAAGPVPVGRRKWVRWAAAAGGVALVVAVAVGCGALYLARNVEPILRQRVVETLTARFHAPVELDHLDISVARGLEVRGSGLRVLNAATPAAGPSLPGQPQANSAQANGEQPAQPLLSVEHFTFRTSVRGLLHSPTRIARVYVQGMEVHVPPAGMRPALLGGPLKKQAKIALLVDQIVCDRVRLFIESSKPGKDPLEFDLQRIVLTDVGSARPFVYDAELTNPKPVGEIHAGGHFGPWQGDDPRSTPVDGDYTFSHADLSSIHGLGGTLSSTGHFAGALGHITVDGVTDTPNFSLDLSSHPEPLHTRFHAFVDGLTGDTTLDPVEATLRNTPIEARGTVVRIHGKGHDILLDVKVANGRIEDLLQLGVKTEPPVMRGAVAVAAKLHVPPGPERVARKLQLRGTVKVQGVEFSNTKWQDRIDGLSLRAQGKPEEARAAGSDRKPEVASQLTTNFAVDHGLITFDSVVYTVPGAEVLLDGAYAMDGSVFEFRGHVRTEATASEMVTGWKSLLLRPMDRLFKKNGAGMELPIEVSGTKGDLKMGLALGGTKETPQQMAAEVKTRSRTQESAKRKP